MISSYSYLRLRYTLYQMSFLSTFNCPAPLHHSVPSSILILSLLHRTTMVHRGPQSLLLIQWDYASSFPARYRSKYLGAMKNARAITERVRSERSLRSNQIPVVRCRSSTTTTTLFSTLRASYDARMISPLRDSPTTFWRSRYAGKKTLAESSLLTLFFSLFSTGLYRGLLGTRSFAPIAVSTVSSRPIHQIHHRSVDRTDRASQPLASVHPPTYTPFIGIPHSAVAILFMLLGNIRYHNLYLGIIRGRNDAFLWIIGFLHSR